MAHISHRRQIADLQLRALQLKEKEDANKSLVFRLGELRVVFCLFKGHWKVY